MIFFNKKLNKLCVMMRNSFELNTHLFFWEERFISVLLCSQKNSFESYILLIYSLLKSFLRIFLETWHLSFWFQCYLFILKSVVDKVLLLKILFLIYELNAIVSIHSNVFYPATSTLKILYANFFWERFVTICLLCKFFIH